MYLIGRPLLLIVMIPCYNTFVLLSSVYRMDREYLIRLQNRTGYITSEFKYQFPEISIPFLTIMTISSVGGFFGNILTISAITMSKELNFEGNLFVINLSTSDLWISTLVVPMNMVGILVGEIFFLERQLLCSTIGSICLIACICSLLNICAVGINRFVYIVKNHIYRKIYTRRSCSLYCLCIWVLAFLLQMPNYIGWGGHIYDKKTRSCAYDRMAARSFTLFFAGVIVSLPVIATSYSYIKIYLYWKKANARISGQLSKKERSADVKSMKLARVLFLIFFSFLVCWMPYGLVATIDWYDTFSEVVHSLVVTMAHFNSAINAVIYGTTNQQFRRAYGMIIRKLLFLKEAKNVSTNATTSHQATRDLIRDDDV